jgi:hypothetical protein
MTIAINAAVFTSAQLEPVAMFWGNGHTTKTDPTLAGWRVRRVFPGREIWLVGRKGVAGCASIWVRPGRGLDVALYDEEPAVVDAALRSRKTLDCKYVEMPDHSGIGLRIIQEIKEWHAMA